jgi:mRNA interferase MazF
MATFKLWDIVKVPFPYADRPVLQRRPALVIAGDSIEAGYGLLWVLTADGKTTSSSDLSRAGLPAPSVVRCVKVATIESGHAERIGSLDSSDRSRVVGHFRRILRGKLG